MTTYHCPHCQTTHTLPPRTTEPLAETVKHNHALRVARLRLAWLWEYQDKQEQQEMKQ